MAQLVRIGEFENVWLSIWSGYSRLLCVATWKMFSQPTIQPLLSDSILQQDQYADPAHMGSSVGLIQASITVTKAMCLQFMNKLECCGGNDTCQTHSFGSTRRNSNFCESEMVSKLTSLRLIVTKSHLKVQLGGHCEFYQTANTPNFVESRFIGHKLLGELPKGYSTTRTWTHEEWLGIR